MTKPSVLAVASLVTCLAGAARADADDYERSERKPQLEGAFGLYVGSFDVGWFHGSAVGVHGDVGVRLDRLLLLGEYSFMSITNDPAATGDSSAMATTPPAMTIIDGYVHRIGADARYSVGKLAGGRHVRMRGDFWLEAGVGEQFVRWRLGGALHRPDVALGFGAQMSVRWGDHRQHHVGFYYAFRATLAPAPYSSASQQPTCAGPCDTATRPTNVDGSALFNFGAVFGN